MSTVAFWLFLLTAPWIAAGTDLAVDTTLGWILIIVWMLAVLGLVFSWLFEAANE